MVNDTVFANLKDENQENINAHYDEIRNVYITYRTVVRPFVAMLELFDREFPIEILNEIRAIFQHIARCYYSEDDFRSVDIKNDSAIFMSDQKERRISDIKKNIHKANGHINRALLDCFKYSCVTLFDEYKSFTTMYKYVDLSSLDNGEFLKKMHTLKEEAKLADKLARIEEGDSGDEINVFRLYEDAFNKSVKLYDYISAHAKYAVNLKRKLRIYSIVSAVGWIIGVASGVRALWSAFGTKIINILNSFINFLNSSFA